MIAFSDDDNDRADRKRAYNRDYQAGFRAAGQRVTRHPKVVDPDRRAACEHDLERYFRTYYPSAFTLPFSEDHDRAIAKIQRAAMEGGLFAFAMPRGSGKTVICERAAIWAVSYGHRRFPCIVGASEKASGDNLAHIKTELELNELLYEDFPEICHYIRALERETRRCRGQKTEDGSPTLIEWGALKIVLPTIEGSVASGAVITVCGITGAIRGQQHVTADGVVLRPDWALLDDPQTRESAASRSQCETREATIAGDVLGMAGPGKKIAAVMPCTVIHQNDVADNFLDRRKHPQWQGERTKLVYEWPKRQDLWDKYAELRAESFRTDGDGSPATEFYRERQADMDEGSVVAWADRKNDDELSAIQHAWNLRLRDEAAFFAEYQNDPRSKVEESEPIMSADAISQKINGYQRGLVPSDAAHLSAFIDVQDKLLFWMVCGWRPDFTGYVIDYGEWPEQSRSYFTLYDVRRTLADAVSGGGHEAAWHAGLTGLCAKLLGEWKVDGGGAMTIGRCLIDANYGKSTDTVYSFVRQSPHAAVLLPTHGRGVKATQMPMHQWQPKQGEQAGLNWRVRRTTETRAPVRHGIYDVNFWKSFIHARLAVPLGGHGCLSLFKAKPHEHRMLADHLTAEFRIKVEAQGRTVEEWQEKPDKPDNHWLDCLVGCAVGASILGAKLETEYRKPKRQKVSLSDYKARAG